MAGAGFPTVIGVQFARLVKSSSNSVITGNVGWQPSSGCSPGQQQRMPRPGKLAAMSGWRQVRLFTLLRFMWPA